MRNLMTLIYGIVSNFTIMFSFQHQYSFDPAYESPVAYFSMEYAIHQPLKLYAGGLGFLSGSHMRSAYELKQNMIGIGILWKYGYYDQVRKSDQTMDVLFQEKVYGFLEKTDIHFTIRVSKHDVHVNVWYLPPHIFKTAPLFFLTTDIDENDYLARTISHRLYDSNPETRIAASILLGVGGAKLLEILQWKADTFHLNESHALPLAFYLFQKSRDINTLQKQLVFTNHTPEAAGNQQTDIYLLDRMDFFCGLSIEEVKRITKTTSNVLDHTLAALRLAGIANAVSKLHQNTLNQMWKGNEGICEIISITNAQNFTYWNDPVMYNALGSNNDTALVARKRECKVSLFEEVADQNGEIYDPDILTLVFAKRFAGYKRPELLFQDKDRFHRIVSNKERPVQIIWAGKPHPMDYNGIASFDKVVNICKSYFNCSILAGYELKLSRILKQGADLWLNLPRITHEASGTSGMSAAMNGCINLSIPDGWFPEFARHEINSFVIPPANTSLPWFQQDDVDASSLYDLLEKTVIPLYYDHPSKWISIVKNSMMDITGAFDSNRMAREYYELMYGGKTNINELAPTEYQKNL